MLLRSNLTLLGLKSRPKKEKAVQLFRQTAFIHKLAPQLPNQAHHFGCQGQNTRLSPAYTATAGHYAGSATLWYQD